MAVSKTSDHIQIKIKMLNPSQDPPALTKAPNQDSKDINDLCTLESQNLDLWCIKIKIKMTISIKEPLTLSKAPNQDSKDIAALCTLKIKNESQNLEHGSITDKWQYLNQDK